MKNKQTNTHTRSNNEIANSMFSMKAMTSMLVVATLLTISACGAGGAGGDSAPSGPTADSPLSGRWGACFGGREVVRTFTKTSWTEQQGVYQNENCSGPSLPGLSLNDLVFAGSYSVIGNSTSEDGLPVMQISMTSETLDGIGLFESAKVTRYNIVYTGTPNQLVFGEFTNNPNDIPTKLNFDEPYSLR